MSGYPKVKVEEGLLEGDVTITPGGKEYYQFLGIPYAEAPVGNLRFRPPVPVKSWPGVKDAKKEGGVCCQAGFADLTEDLGQEDCLFLNVYTPKLPSATGKSPNLPVMVFIHGGGFVTGSGSYEDFGPDFLLEQDVVFVSINYRLSVLGFLCLDSPNAPGNVGLRDQTLALKWIKNNIDSFNGRPDKITLFGISAGSASVEFQLLSPMSRGLFQKAILQSGSTLNSWARSTEYKDAAYTLAKRLDITYRDDEDLIVKLREVDPMKLVVEAAKCLDPDLLRRGELFAFVPVVEKVFPDFEPFLCQEPLELFRAGKFARIPTITGFCAEEGPFFKLLIGELIKNMTVNNLAEYLPKTLIGDLKKQNEAMINGYTSDNNRNTEEQLADFLSDNMFIGGIYTSLMHRLRFVNDMYSYEFAYSGNLNLLKVLFNVTNAKGAYHGDDTGYLALSNRFLKEENATDQDKLVRSRMIKMWTDFAKTGNPTPKKNDLIKEQWPKITPDDKKVMLIEEDLKVIDFPWTARMKVWEDLYKLKSNL